MTDLVKLADVETELRENLERGYSARAQAILADLHPADIADILDVMDEDLRLLAFSLLEDEIASEVLDETQAEATQDLVEAVPDERLADLLEELPMDDAAELLGDLPPEQAETLIALMEPEEAAEVRVLLEYSDETAGRLMTEKVVRIRRRWTAQETIDHLRRIDPETETLAYLYVVDDEDLLVSVVPLRALMTAPAGVLVRDIMEPDVLSVTVDTDQEEVARLVAKYDFFAIPVVDREGRLAGIITHDDVVDILEEEFTEDVQRLGGSQPLERPYFAVSIPQVVRKRAGWLLLLFATGGLMSGAVMRYFESELAAVVALGAFIPLVTGTGGNAGSQAVATIIRGLALDDIRTGDLLRVLVREVITGLGVGVMLGIVGMVLALFWKTGPHLGLTFTLTLVAVCVWANVFGALIPIIADRVGIDPAVVSTPFITTVVDAAGLFIYFSLAKLILGI
ncbi:MAG: magnesium transporter [Anaerolineae bacterium]